VDEYVVGRVGAFEFDRVAFVRGSKCFTGCGSGMIGRGDREWVGVRDGETAWETAWEMEKRGSVARASLEMRCDLLDS
jgi:hypothetical protein